MNLEEIQKKIEASIKDALYSQREIAAAIGVSQQTISKYMKCDIFSALDTLAKLCKFLDVSADYILELREEKY